MTNVSELLWSPDQEWIDGTNIISFMKWLKDNRGLDFSDYHALWKWSVDDIDAFWRAIWDYFDIQASTPVGATLAKRDMLGAEWFPGVRLNYAEHILRQEKKGGDALLYLNETTGLQAMSWDDLGSKVRTLAQEMRRLGVEPGDRVVAYMPNVPETVVAMLAATSIGAIWASCSPDFGVNGVLDRLSQIGPKILFCVDGYRYGGKSYDRREALSDIVAGLDSLVTVIHLPYLGLNIEEKPVRDQADYGPNHVLWDDIFSGASVPVEDFEFAELPFDHPLWILSSSGTTGLPKAIVHSHGGILLEMNKSLHLMMDIKLGDRVFFYTTTGWMMWNFLVSSLLVGACPVFYDGNPVYPEPDILWKMAQDSKASFFGASPTYVDIMDKAGIVPKNHYDLSHIRSIMPAGSPVSPECTAWFYNNVKSDLWVATGSGGTDCCTGFVGGVSTLPVYAGEMQAPALGVAAYAFNDAGEAVVNEVGELVITEPMPSMPVGFWGDDDGRIYRESYFDTFPGVWHHGDLFKMNERRGCFVLGRSDATLNRQGIRIGTAEIYRALQAVDDIEDALIVSLNLPDQIFFMPLFVQLVDGVVLDEALCKKINAKLRSEYTPRHVPDKIIQVPLIPTTLSGKRMEVPVRKILQGGIAEKVANRSAMADGTAIDFFIKYAQTQNDYVLA